MEWTEQEKWTAYHRGEYRSSMEEVLALSWDKSIRANVNPNKKTFDLCSEAEYLKAKEESFMLFLYCNRLLKDLVEKTKDSSIGYAIFDPACRLMRLYGSESFMEWASDFFLQKKTIWTENSIGANAVTIGINEKRPFLTDSSDHFSQLLLPAFVSFAPCILNLPNKDYEEACLGGIAAIGPSSPKAYEYLLVVSSLIKEVGMHISMCTHYAFWNSEVSGVLSVDLTKNSNLILYINRKVYEVLDIPYRNFEFKKIDQVFDPYPKNKELWNIIEHAKTVQDYRITLSMQGIKRNFIISTSYIRQAHLGYACLVFMINSDKRVNTYISKRIGNNAQLTFEDILGESEAINDVVIQGKRISRSESNVLILGESGVGKDIFAQAIHNNSSRKNGPYITINCAAIPRDLIASELFGYEHGAFSGSKKGGNKGKFELADTGTLFLDEIGDMPLDLQAVLLRAVEEKRFLKLGGNEYIHTDIRIICATNANLQQKIDQNLFREDLFYRISVLMLRIPPLRERGADILVLSRAFISSACRRLNIPDKELSVEASTLLMSLPWKGNVRELQNMIESVLQLYSDKIIQAEHITKHIEAVNYVGQRYDSQTIADMPSISSQNMQVNFNGEVITKETVESALLCAHYNKSTAANNLGVSRKTLYKWIHLFGIEG